MDSDKRKEGNVLTLADGDIDEVKIIYKIFNIIIIILNIIFINNRMKKNYSI